VQRQIRTLVIALALVPAFLLATGTVASAWPRQCGEHGRPACTILRPPELGPPPDAPYDAPECVVLVGGFGSTNGDRAFDDLFRWSQDEPLYQIFQFGYRRSDRFEYDTTGRIDVSAEHLASFVRSLTPDCRAIHIVAHSMGGAVADRAFKMGLSDHDRVATYVALSSPHNGATLAKALKPSIERDSLVAIEISVLARTLGQPDPTTPAGHDLALIEPPLRPIRDTVAHGRLRVATDAMVLRRDNVDRREDVREYFEVNELEGHGGILHNDQVRRVLQTTIASHALAADNRSALERRVADAVATRVDAALSALYRETSEFLTWDPRAPLALAGAYEAVEVAKVVWDAVSGVLAAMPGSAALASSGALE
jgi:pimeloyl-ACP methyl ester carboxylesterase